MHDLTPSITRDKRAETESKRRSKSITRARPSYKCAEYEDFRTMLEKEKGIDAILCATPGS